MAFDETQWAALVAHGTGSSIVHAMEARARPGHRAGELVFQYVLRAEMSEVRVPAVQQSAARTDGLWRHTCFEAFLVDPAALGYTELNFSLSGQWAAYRFNRYRDGLSPANVTEPPAIDVRCFDDRLELDATVYLASLQGVPALKLALAAVIEDNSGTLSYWALRHAPGKPDFHHPDGFVLELAL